MLKTEFLNDVYSVRHRCLGSGSACTNSRIQEVPGLPNRAYPAVLLTQVSDTTHSMIGYQYLLAAV